MTRLRTCVTYFSLVYSAAPRILSARVWYAVFEYHPEKHNAFHSPAESATAFAFSAITAATASVIFGETARPPFFGVVMFLNVGNGRLIRERGFIRDILTKSARAVLFGAEKSVFHFSASSRRRLRVPYVLLCRSLFPAFHFRAREFGNDRLEFIEKLLPRVQSAECPGRGNSGSRRHFPYFVAVPFRLSLHATRAFPAPAESPAPKAPSGV